MTRLLFIVHIGLADVTCHKMRVVASSAGVATKLVEDWMCTRHCTYSDDHFIIKVICEGVVDLEEKEGS